MALELLAQRAHLLIRGRRLGLGLGLDFDIGLGLGLGVGLGLGWRGGAAAGLCLGGCDGLARHVRWTERRRPHAAREGEGRQRRSPELYLDSRFIR